MRLQGSSDLPSQGVPVFEKQGGISHLGSQSLHLGAPLRFLDLGPIPITRVVQGTGTEKAPPTSVNLIDVLML